MVSKRESTGNETLNEILTEGKSFSSSTTAGEAFEEVKPHAGESAYREHDASGPEVRPDLLRGIHLRVRVELGRRSVPLRDALRLEAGSIIDLQKDGDDPVNLYVNDLLLARGVVMVVDDCFCIRVTEVLPRT